MLASRQIGPVALRAASIPRITSFQCNIFNKILNNHRSFSFTPTAFGLKPYLLADIGEGITECQIISWAVKPGDKVEQFDPICEVQSDKASVEITSRFAGVVERLHYGEGELAKVGSPLLDIDVVEEDTVSNLSKTVSASANNESETTAELPSSEAESTPVFSDAARSNPQNIAAYSESRSSNGAEILVTPAVRRLTKENSINIYNVKGTGKGGRILKEDVLKYIDASANNPLQESQLSIESETMIVSAGNKDRKIQFSPVQTQMFKSMTASLAIPHFLYTHTVDVGSLMSLRKQIQTEPSLSSSLADANGSVTKLTLLPFVLKALSQALIKFPMMNSVLDVNQSESNEQPELIIKGSHNFGVAVDTPNGLLVPVIRNVQDHSVFSLAAEISRLGKLARNGKLRPEDMTGGTIVVSNIGSIGGNVVAPVILSPMVAIVAIGQIEEVPAFEKDKNGIENIVKKQRVVLSWSADHRILDGATVARCAQNAALWLENPEYLGLALR